MRTRVLVSCLLMAVLASCAPTEVSPPSSSVSSESSESAESDRLGRETAAQLEWAIAIHGGAGTVSADKEQHYLQSLSDALELGRRILEGGGSSLDAVEQVIRNMEDDPLFNAGKGAVFTNAGTNELDAAILDGRDLGCGAVTGIRRVKNPITLARIVMEQTKHVFLAGEGAEALAVEHGLEMVESDYFFTQSRFDSLQRALEREKQSRTKLPADAHGTVGAVALDREGNLAAATSTGGLTNKRFGRIGDVPVIGAGTYADNESCAISCTGVGEEFIRHTVARTVSVLIEYRGMELEDAANELIFETLKQGDGGLIGVNRRGAITLAFSTTGMPRGAADSTGRFEVAVGKN
ncbi:MAG: isoaspartyl peptidase/L-asparaginase [Acidobacteriota bacterium]|nr:MAG: isoaspartyl peptidase/L-asparaginase [Acidobacteriota bacterium]